MNLMSIVIVIEPVQNRKCASCILDYVLLVAAFDGVLDQFSVLTRQYVS
ncbi:MAG: hypothetical protein ACI8PZ_002215 [Myxococcota bacterium]|jgi:hypothetical protein